MQTSELEKEHRKLFPKRSEAEWLEIFPQAKEFIIWKIGELRREMKARAVETLAKVRVIKEKSVKEKQWFWFMVIERLDIGVIVELSQEIRKLKTVLHPNLTRPKMFGKMAVERAGNTPIQSIVDFTLKKSGKAFVGRCPFHIDRTPSFYIYLDTNTYHCYGCLAHGDAIKFIMESCKIPFKKAVRLLLAINN